MMFRKMQRLSRHLLKIQSKKQLRPSAIRRSSHILSSSSLAPSLFVLQSKHFSTIQNANVNANHFSALHRHRNSSRSPFKRLSLPTIVKKANCSASAAVSSSSSVNITDACAKRMNYLRNKRQNNGLVLRVAVSSGGCSGFQYEFEFTTEDDVDTDDDDQLLIHNKAKFVIDTTSMKFIKGAKLDYIEDLIQRSFVIVDNPNVVSNCGCNVSFSPTPELLEAASDDDDDK